MTGTTLWAGPIRWSPRARRPRSPSRVGPRVGVSQAADVDLRFWLAGEPIVSAYRRSKRA